MPRKNQRCPIDDTATDEVRAHVCQLRTLVDATQLSDKEFAHEMGCSPGYLSKLLSGSQIVGDRTVELHEVACRLIGHTPVSRRELLTLHYQAALSAPERCLKEHKRARKHLPVPPPRGDRQVRASSTRTEVFLADLLKQEGCRPLQTLDVLHAGADVLGPPEAANIVASLQHQGKRALADDFARIYGREQDKLSVIHAARDLLDPYDLPSAASRLLTAAMPPGHAGNAT
ncbi:hypothetical protein JW613_28355 [Streptomyces smyrnaeus]|uniref:XRE family transcriptional regulator n=1 Tax=Streptomyces smyrnaeus TaxID=1387713 RepID=A0ABS3Y3D4_9ACTN|nr:hypothetical protein [Streptomyces smyrnaeus]MBO8202174.1 hypothetical protein [Streptomyces smyrnaeus]